VEDTPEEDWSEEADDESSPDDVSYGSLLVVADDDEVVVGCDAVVVEPPAVACCSDGSSPSWSRSASTPNTATKLAVAPAAKRRGLGARRRRLLGSSAGMATASPPRLNQA
jgi:GNAT superfamily N-acetyltransferase